LSSVLSSLPLPSSSRSATEPRRFFFFIIRYSFDDSPPFEQIF
jgi:hypothetical protein